MNWGLFVLILLGVFNVTLSYAKHGQPRDNYNGWVMLIATTLDILLGFWIAGWRFI